MVDKPELRGVVVLKSVTYYIHGSCTISSQNNIALSITPHLVKWRTKTTQTTNIADLK